MRRILLTLAFLVCMAGAGAAAELTDIAGRYISKQEPKEYIMLYADGTFHLKQRRVPASIENPFMEVSGRFRVEGDSVVLMLSSDNKGEATAMLKLQRNTMEDDEGTKWVKEGSEHKPVERAKRLKW